MESSVKKIVPWPEDITILPGNVEEILTFGSKELKRFNLPEETKNIAKFQPLFVNLGDLSPKTTNDRLSAVGLRPANLREYLSFRRHVEREKVDIGQCSFVFVGEFPISEIGESWLRVLSFFKKGEEYEGLICDCHPQAFLTPEIRERDYGYDHYAVTVKEIAR